MKEDIQNRKDIELMVDTFYTRIREDNLLGPIFDEKIQQEWPKHLNIMYSFWESILLGNNTYNGHPFAKHISLPISESHFARWLYLFHTTVDSLFQGPIADEAKKRAAQIAAIFNSKLHTMRSNNAG